MTAAVIKGTRRQQRLKEQAGGSLGAMQVTKPISHDEKLAIAC